jgi:excinuclease ABC subunit C
MSREPKVKKNKDLLQEKLGILPEAPGVYLHKNKQGKVIYVGKARKLSQRVRSYFQSGSEKDSKTQLLVQKITDFDYIVTDTDGDALVLENQLIKEYRPLYNVRLKDDKQYPYIKISIQEEFPRVTVVRQIEKDGARYFGPFTDVRAMRETLKFTASAFQVRTCHLNLPENTVPRACLDWQIGRCSAPCVGYDTAQGYGEKVGRMVKFLDGSTNNVIKELTVEMENMSANLEFEAAAKIRDLREKLVKTTGSSKQVAGISTDCDLCGVARDGEDASGVVMRVRGGHILTTHHFLLSDKLESDLSAFMAQLLREYYRRAGDIPGEIYLHHAVDDMESWQAWLSAMREKTVLLAKPQRGAKKEAVGLAHTNAAFKLREINLKKDLKKVFNVTPADIELQEALQLHSVPETIECFDISNFQGNETVASLVYFKKSKPLKSRYRRFRIKTVEGIDDFASMAEVLDRYYGKLVDKGLAPADLVVVDGGKGQLSAARAILAKYGLHSTQLIGLAKREETIVRENGSINLPRNSEALKLLQRVRDEAHRFAITYHRLIRDRRTVASVLDQIPGIGPTKKLSLLHHFGSVVMISKAKPEELADVRGINKHDIVVIREFFAKNPIGE